MTHCSGSHFRALLKHPFVKAKRTNRARSSISWKRRFCISLVNVQSDLMMIIITRRWYVNIRVAVLIANCLQCTQTHKHTRSETIHWADYREEDDLLVTLPLLRPWKQSNCSYRQFIMPDILIGLNCRKGAGTSLNVNRTLSFACVEGPHHRLHQSNDSKRERERKCLSSSSMSRCELSSSNCAIESRHQLDHWIRFVAVQWSSSILLVQYLYKRGIHLLLRVLEWEREEKSFSLISVAGEENWYDLPIVYEHMSCRDTCFSRDEPCRKVRWTRV